MSHSKTSLKSLLAWIETFQTVDQKIQYEDLIQQSFLFDVIAQLDNRPLWAEPIGEANDSASQIHNACILFVQILSCYVENLRQAPLVPLPDLAALVGAGDDREASEREMHKLLLLTLGLAIQCERKDELIAVMELLPSGVQDDIMESYKLLTKQLVRLDSVGEEAVASLRRSCEDRLECFKKYSEAIEEKCYLETVVLSSQSFGPDLKSLRPPESFGDFHNFQLMLDAASQQATSLSEQLEEKSAEAGQLAAKLQKKKEKVKKLKAQLRANSSAGQSAKVDSLSDEIERLKEKLKKFEAMEGEVYTLRQRQTEFDFYKSRVQELRDENSQLIEDKQHFEELLTSSRKKEEDVIERLVECQMRYDELAGQREADAEKTRGLLENADRLEAENRRLKDSLASSGGGRAAGGSGGGGGHDGGGGGMSLAAELASAARIRDLEAEVERLRASGGGAAAGDDKQERWKFLEVKKELVQTRRDLRKATERLEAERQRCQRLDSKLSGARKAKEDHEQELASTRQSHEEHVRDLERRIHELTNQIVLLKRKGSEAMKGLREAELAEMEVMFQSVQELTSQLARLKNNNKILRQSCDKLKAEVYKIFTIEQENERLLAENRELRKVKATESTAQVEWEEVRRKNLQLEVENKKLRRIVESLKLTLVQIDPYNKMRYHYITSL